eukprot:gene3500-2451_t
MSVNPPRTDTTSRTPHTKESNQEYQIAKQATNNNRNLIKGQPITAHHPKTIVIMYENNYTLETKVIEIDQPAERNTTFYTISKQITKPTQVYKATNSYLQQRQPNPNTKPYTHNKNARVSKLQPLSNNGNLKSIHTRNIVQTLQAESTHPPQTNIIHNETFNSTTKSQQASVPGNKYKVRNQKQQTLYKTSLKESLYNTVTATKITRLLSYSKQCNSK